MQNLRRLDRPHWSFSSLNQILNICSLQYYFQRVARIAPAFTPLPLSFGSAVHRALEYINRIRMEPGADLPDAEEGRGLFARIWERQLEQDADIRFGDKHSPESCRDEGAGLIECFIKAVDPDERVLSVSETFALPIVDAAGESLENPLVGEIDCVAERGGRPVLIDWKTAARRWPQTQADKSLQATAYSYAYGRLHGCGLPGFRFDVLVKNNTPVFQQLETRRSEDDVARFAALARQAERIVAGELYYPSEHGFACGGCQFAGPCREWHRVQAA